MGQSGVLAKLKVGTRIWVGFAAVLILLFLIVGFGVYGLSISEGGFRNYADVSENALKVVYVERDVAEMRRNVLVFAATGNDAAEKRAQEIMATLGDDIQAVLESTDDPQRRRNLQRMHELFEQYRAGFDRVLPLRHLRERLIREGMDVIGKQTRENLSQVIRTAMVDEDLEAAAYAGIAQESLMLARLNANRYIAQPSEERSNLVREHQAAFERAAQALLDRLQNPERRQLAQDTLRLAREYQGKFTEVQAAVNEVEGLVNGTMAAEAAEFAELAKETTGSQAQERDDQLAATEAEMEQTRLISIIIGVFAALLGILAAWIVSRSIIRPVSAMTQAMGDLAGGNLAIEIPALGHRDEVGEMAGAVQVFKDNAIQKRQMDEAERQRVDAEREAAEAQRRREQAIGEEIAGLVEAVSKGDLKRRIGLDDKDGVFRSMSEGMNRLADTIAAIITDLSDVLSALAQGDLNRRITKDFQGSFETLKANVNATSTKLAEVVGEIGASTDAIANAAAEVAVGSSDLSERTEQQASSLEETAASMEELGATVRTTAENAERANGMAAHARKAAENGGQVAEAAVESMKEIEESSRKITDIIGVIDEIAFQTNLLALNAAVEAARAGEAGRGFAVVAQEVRVLAQRSAQASKEIKSLILSSGTQVKNGVDMVTQAGEALTGIVKGVQDVAAVIGEMANATREQASSLDEINSAVAQMDEVTQKNAALVEETTAASRTMADQADQLRQLMAFFKLDQMSQGGQRASGGRMATSAGRSGSGNGGGTRASGAAAATSKTRSNTALRRPAAVASGKARSSEGQGHGHAASGGAKGSPARPHPSPAAQPAGGNGGGAFRRLADDSDDDWKEF